MGGRGSYGRGGGGDGGGCGGSDGLGGGGGGGGGDWQSAAAATATTAAAANLPRVRQWRRRQSAVEGLAVAIAVAAVAFPQRLMPAVAAVAAPSIAAAASAAVAEAVAATGGTLEEAVDWRRRAATSKWRLHVAIAVADHTFAVAAVSAALAPPTPPPPPLPLTLAVASVRPSARCPPRFGGLCWREWEGVTTWSELLLLSLPLPQRVPLGLSALPLLLPLPLLSPLQSRITSPPPPLPLRSAALAVSIVGADGGQGDDTVGGTVSAADCFWLLLRPPQPRPQPHLPMPPLLPQPLPSLLPLAPLWLCRCGHSLMAIS